MTDTHLASLEKGYQAVLEFIDKMEEISQIQDKIDITSNISQIWKLFLHEIQNSIKMDGCALFMVDEKSFEFTLKSASPRTIGNACQQEIDMQIECGMFSWIVKRRKPALIPSLVFKNNKTLIMLPLVTIKRTLGMVVIVTGVEESAITQETMKLLTMLAKQCSLVLENALLYDRLRSEHESLQYARDQILQAEKLAAIGKLTAGASHEILNPLNIISGYIQLMQMAGDMDARKTKYLTVMHDQVDRITQIVNSLYRFSRPSETRKEAVQINMLLEKALHLFDHENRYDRIIQELNLAKDLPAIMGSSDTLSQVFIILFANARDAMPDGGTLKMNTRLVPAGNPVLPQWDCIEIQVADTGLGIPQKNINSIFDPFFSTKTHRNGTGLGLSLAYGIIQEHGGTITVDSQEGVGTTFTIILPCRTSDSGS